MQQIETPEGRIIFASADKLNLVSFLHEDGEDSGVMIHDKDFAMFNFLPPESWDSIIDVIEERARKAYEAGVRLGIEKGRMEMADTIQEALGVDKIINAIRGED